MNFKSMYKKARLKYTAIYLSIYTATSPREDFVQDYLRVKAGRKFFKEQPRGRMSIYKKKKQCMNLAQCEGVAVTCHSCRLQEIGGNETATRHCIASCIVLTAFATHCHNGRNCLESSGWLFFEPFDLIFKLGSNNGFVSNSSGFCFYVAFNEI